MAESIAVGYRQIEGGVFHKFIVYTDSSGNQWATSAWPENQLVFKFTDFSYRGISGTLKSANDWGALVTIGGTSNPRRYDSSFRDYPWNPNGSERYPGKK